MGTNPLAAINSVALAIGRFSSLDEMLDHALRKVLEVVQAEAGALYLLDEEHGELSMAMHHGLSERAWRDFDHLRGRRHFKIKRPIERLLQPRDVLVADVTAIFAQMRGDAVGARGDRNFGGMKRIGMTAAACVTKRRDVVDVDAQSEKWRCTHGATIR